MRLIRVVFEERAAGGPRVHQRDYGPVISEADAMNRAKFLVAKEYYFQSGYFQVQRRDGTVIGEIETENGATMYSGQHEWAESQE